MECSQFNTPMYTRLCQILSLPPDKKNRPRAFTGNPNVDMEILGRMDDEDLLNVCQVNKYVNDLCNRESFWANKVLNKYGRILGSGEEIKRKYLNNGSISWKEYYLWLSDVLNSPSAVKEHIATVDNREDVRKLIGKDSLCTEMDPGKYQDLCNTLSHPIKSNRLSPRAFTGNPMADLEILKNLSDEDLVNVCRVNTYTHNLCNDKYFWANKVLTKFPQLGSAEEIKKYMKGMEWKDYYLWLSDLFGDYSHVTHQTDDGPAYSLTPESQVGSLSDLYPKATAAFKSTGREDLGVLLGINLEQSHRGFTKPIKLTNEMREFIINGNFGLADPENPSAGPLQNYLSAAVNGVSNKGIMIPLLNIYVKFNNLADGAYIQANPEMYRYLGNTFRALRSVNPEKFRHTDLQRIIAQNIVPREQLTERDLDVMNSFEMNQRLKLENDLVSDLLKYYRAN